MNHIDVPGGKEEKEKLGINIVQSLHCNAVQGLATCPPTCSSPTHKVLHTVQCTLTAAQAQVYGAYNRHFRQGMAVE